MRTPGSGLASKASTPLGFFLHDLDSSHAFTLPNKFYNQRDHSHKNVVEHSPGVG